MDKTLDKVESGVAKARDKIDTIGEKTKEQFQNWKRVLSGALNDPQLILGLSVLFAFYVFLTSFNSIIGGNSQEENTITCGCPVLHRVFYQTVIIISLSIWFFGFLLITTWDAFKFWRYRYKSRHPEKYQPSSETQEHTISFLERTIDSVQGGAQAMMKVPVKSMLTKALDVIDDGVETLRVVDDGIKQLKENPIDAILTKTLESMSDPTNHHRFEDSNPKIDDDDDDDDGDNDDDDHDDDDESKPSMLQNATELIDMARQDSILGKLVKPIDEKLDAAKQTTAGSVLTDLVTSGTKMVQENPVDLMLTKAMEVVGDKTQPNQASSMLAKSVQFVASVKESPSEALLAASVGVADKVVSSQLQKTQQIATKSMLSTSMDSVNAGMQAINQDPVQVLSNKAMERAAASATETNPTTSSMLDESIKLANTMKESPSEALLSGVASTVLSSQLQNSDTVQQPAIKSMLPAAMGLVDAAKEDPIDC